ncbi:hypothetical protein [Actinoplanes auranticolor]|uniref:hypothetical protein n=1 Tax=Actinoplanes auranticolor TaxID=47988 RepID=UPI001BB38C3A|nr:hypothetical protein [Actinoplanes auranticolor]
MGATVVVGVGIGVATELMTDPPTIAWLVIIAALTVIAVAIQIGLLMSDGGNETTPSGSYPAVHQTAATIGNGSTSQVGRDVNNGLGGGPIALIAGVVGLLLLAAVVVVWNLRQPRDPSRETAQAAGAPSVTASGPTTPFAVKVLLDPQKYVDPKHEINTVNSFLFPAGGLTAEKPDKYCYAWHSWAREKNAADVEVTNFAISISAVTSDVVQVTGAELVATDLSDPHGDVAACEQGGETTHSFLNIDLDKRKLDFLDGGLKPVPFMRTIKPADPEVVYVKATATTCYCSWQLVLDISVAGKDYPYTVDNNGKPFVTAPREGNYRYFLYDSGKWIG